MISPIPLLMKLPMTAAEGPDPEGRVGTPPARGARYKEVSPYLPFDVVNG